MSAPKIITVYVKGRARKLSMAERVLFAPQNSGKATDALLWPIEVPEYGKTAAAKKIRNRNRWDAVNAADALLDRCADAIASGMVVHVNIGDGAICTGVMTGDKDTSVFGNVAAPWLLRELCNVAAHVNVPPSSEDPREYDGWEPGQTEED